MTQSFFIFDGWLFALLYQSAVDNCIGHGAHAWLEPTARPGRPSVICKDVWLPLPQASRIEPAATANPEAATAAAAAAAVFRRHESSASLSASAAAAALRARPTTPTRVADVQTKRTMRRSASVASARTAPERAGDPTALRRHGSSGSMAERTFRTPSPHRPSLNGDPPPPVPALPRDIDAATSGPPRRLAGSIRLSGAPLRLASQKLASGDAPSWFGPAKLGDLGSVRRVDPAMASPPSSPPSVAPREEEEDPSEGARPGSRGSSVNFSYPTRMRRGSTPVLPATEASPTAPASSRTDPASAALRDSQPATTRTATQPPPRRQPVASSRGRPPSASADQELVYDANSRRMVRQADLLAAEHAQQALSGISPQPTAPRKKRTPQRTGSHRAAGTTASAARAQPPTPAPQDQPQPPVRPRQPRGSDRPPGSQRDPGEYSGSSAVVDRPRPMVAEKLGQPTAERAVVDRARAGSRAVTGPASVPPDTAQFVVRRQPSVIQEKPEPEEAKGEERGQTGVAQEEARAPMTPPQNVGAASQRSFDHHSAGRARQGAGHGPAESSSEATEQGGRTAHVSPQRTHSSSPIRQAHFGPVQDSLTVRHSPPPRSSSPRKSAMKQTNPPEWCASPSDDTSEFSRSGSQEPPGSRKKSVRVSFHDGNAKDGADEPPGSASLKGSPLAASPPYLDRHGWLGNNARNHVSASFHDDGGGDDDDDGFVMKPRPALPSFGSVRGRKPRDTSTEEPERPLVRPRGEKRSFLADTAAAQPAAGEPLPPIVTSVEGSGYLSDTSDTSSLLSSEFDPHPAASARQQDASQMPEISISQPTPPGAGDSSSGQYFVHVPGALPDNHSDQSVPSADAPVVEPAERARQDRHPEHPEHPERTPQPLAAESSSDSDSEIYSDAYEDLSELEGDEGFQSLDAVLESPLQQVPPLSAVPQPEQAPKEAPAHVPTEPPDHAAPGETPQPKTGAPPATSTIQSPPVPDPHDDDWEKAKAFWRSLSAEQRALLEKEVLEEAGAKGDGEEGQTETKAEKTTVERTDSARQTMARQTPARKAVSERTSMIHPAERRAGGDGDPEIPAMRKSMRDQPRQEPRPAPVAGSRLRKSMRDGPNAQTEEARTRPKRPHSYPAAVAAAPAPNAEGGHRRSATQIEGIQPSLGRRGSTGSESSFKRSRSARQQGFGFRQSLRPTSPPSTISDGHATTKRFSLRAPSPGSAGSSPTSRMRTTLRGSPAGEPPSSNGFRLPGFSFPYGGAKKSGRTRPGARRARSSRLADSSDEEGGDASFAPGFRSRFDDDSSDEDDDDDDEQPAVPVAASRAYPLTGDQRPREGSSVAGTALPKELEESSGGSQGAGERHDAANLGTRTLGIGIGNGSGGGGGGGFLHFHPRRRGASLSVDLGSGNGNGHAGAGAGAGGGVDDDDDGDDDDGRGVKRGGGGGGGGGSADGSVLEGSLAGASSTTTATTRRKRFGALRKMLRIDD
ncbi:hypothetical protein VTH06DRAFT_8558 [Thermothelomyces fergusii]